MIMGISDGQPVGNTGFSMEELKGMDKPKLLAIFDRNDSGTVSEKELTSRGITGEELSEIKEYMSSVEIENEVEQPKPKRKTRKIEGVTFYDDEVILVNKNYSRNPMVAVTTPYGVFEYFTEDVKIRRGSILGNTVKNMDLTGYTGTVKNDKLYLKNSLLAHIDIAGGGKDIIYYDKDSYARDVTFWQHDTSDEIRFQQQDGSWKVEKNPYHQYPAK